VPKADWLLALRLKWWGRKNAEPRGVEAPVTLLAFLSRLDARGMAEVGRARGAKCAKGWERARKARMQLRMLRAAPGSPLVLGSPGMEARRPSCARVGHFPSRSCLLHSRSDRSRLRSVRMDRGQLFAFHSPEKRGIWTFHLRRLFTWKRSRVLPKICKFTHHGFQKK